MGTLNPDLPSKELHQALGDAAGLMRGMKKRVLMPELLLLVFIRKPGSAAYRVLAHFGEKRGFQIDIAAYGGEAFGKAPKALRCRWSGAGFRGIPHHAL